MAVVVKIRVKIPEWLDWLCAWPFLVYRQLKYGYPYRRISLHDGKYAIVDPADYYRLNNFDWFTSLEHGHFYAVRTEPNGHRKAKTVRMHREIMNAPAGMLVDHQNSDGLDNRRANLRLATYCQNNCNRPKKENTSSRFIGVYFFRSRWCARIKHNKKDIWLGKYDTEIEAARVYDAAAKKYHGEFARLNFTDLTADGRGDHAEKKGKKALFKDFLAALWSHFNSIRSRPIEAPAAMSQVELTLKRTSGTKQARATS